MTVPTSPSPAQRPCPRCGERVGPDDHFCFSCGASLIAAETRPAPRPNTARRVVAIIAGCLAAAAVSGLVVAYLDAR
ncbi:MAG TPA: zinc ribbon domain-containing protein, partial [Ilumatobacteraceae bacterium]|nr:zinc ribbon domain-containing protein [Ilumatobacteraceae bacterium]